MINEEILEGLRRATAAGSTLKSAMMSFYNSGYGKQEIEEAAKELQSQKFGNLSTVVPQQVPQNIQTRPIAGAIPAQQPPQQIPQQVPKQQFVPQQQPQQLINQQNVSNYGKKSKLSGLTIFLIVSLVLLLGILVLMFIFREPLVNFLNRLFS